MLENFGADIHAVDPISGRNLLLSAIKPNDPATFDYLMSKNLDVNTPFDLLKRAIQRGHAYKLGY